MDLDQAIREASEAVQQTCLGGFVPRPSISREAMGELIIAAKEKRASRNWQRSQYSDDYIYR